MKDKFSQSEQASLLRYSYLEQPNQEDAVSQLRLIETYLTQSKYNFGYIYKERNMFNEAIAWFKLAADENFALSQNELALLLLSKRNDQNGYMKYVKLAADQELPGAQINYGSTLIEQGNFKECFSYISLAALQNHPVAVKIMQIRTSLRSQFNLK